MRTRKYRSVQGVVYWGTWFYKYAVRATPKPANGLEVYRGTNDCAGLGLVFIEACSVFVSEVRLNTPSLYQKQPHSSVASLQSLNEALN